jgi:4-aminobutyrate aminotransferase/(S)-3-amino-2-methylpropionate transaminase
VVFTEGYGCNLWDADNNRYVDLAGGFGSLLLGHSHPYVLRALDIQGSKLLQAMGDLYASDARIGLSTQLAELYPERDALVMLGQSGADVVSAAQKTAVLATGKPGIVAFDGAYHGLSYGPLAACGLRPSYRDPFAEQLNPHVLFLPFPTDTTESIQALQRVVNEQPIGAILYEPIQGRGGVHPLPAGWQEKMLGVAKAARVVTIADEIWTGLGRAGTWFASFGGSEPTLVPDLVCLGKGLGGGLPISALVGRRQIMQHWSRAQEVVHTSTFAGAPLACATAVATLDVIRRFDLVRRSDEVGNRYRAALVAALHDLPVEVRGAGMMIGIDLGERAGAASKVMAQLLDEGYVVSTGGTSREVIVLTPPLVIEEELLLGSVAPLRAAVESVCRAI